jgi:hypothetical protein
MQKRANQANPVRAALRGYRFRGVSSYSLLEFKSAWLSRLGYIHSTCRKRAVRCILDVIQRIDAKLGAHPKRHRMMRTCLQQVMAFLDQDKGSVKSRAQLARLERHCKAAILGAEEAMRQMATGVFFGTKCARATETAKEKKNGSLDVAIPQCRPEKPCCSIGGFFRDNEAEFGALAQAIDGDEAASRELQAMRDQIRAAQADAAVLHERKCCSRIADAIIAIDGIGMQDYAAHNPREWRLIAHVFGKTLVDPVAEATEPPHD